VAQSDDQSSARDAGYPLPGANANRPQVGVGPHPQPWPDDARFDPSLLAEGDRRNVTDQYRYWTVEAIVAEAAEIHIVGRKRWNRRGAMVTDRYQHVRHHTGPDELAAWAAESQLPIVGIDNLTGSTPLESGPLPKKCVLLFGQEGPGLSEQIRPILSECRSIQQFGSTRSINAGVAAGIAMHTWIVQHTKPV